MTRAQAVDGAANAPSSPWRAFASRPRRRLATLGALMVASAAGSADATDEIRLNAPGITTAVNFGWSVAVDGDTMAVGAPAEGRGAAYVFARSGSDWSYQTRIAASGASNPPGRLPGGFGVAVAIDGDTLVVGAQGGGGTTLAGFAYVFRRTGSTWTEEARLAPPNPGNAFGDSISFGRAVAVSGDTVVVGAPLDSERVVSPAAVPECGAAYVFVRAGSSWSLQTTLLAADRTTRDEFGHAVAIEADTVLAGAVGDRFNDEGSSVNSGSAYVFVRSGESWSQQRKLNAANPVGSAQFGWSVALSGETAVVGALHEGSPNRYFGAVYVFVRSVGAWTQEQRLEAPDAANEDKFGHAVSILGDTLAVGATHDGDARAGAAYSFRRSGTSWSQTGRYAASDGADYDFFGWSVAVASDGIAVGARQDYVGRPGTVYLYAAPAPPDPPAPIVDSYFLPKRVALKTNTSDAAKSLLTASGFIDVGSAGASLEGPAAIDVGGLHVDVPNFSAQDDGGSFVHRDVGLTFSIVLDRSGSSRARFHLKRVGDVAGLIDADGPLALRFSNAAIDCRGTVRLTAGRYALGRIRGTLIEPNIFVQRATAELRGADADSLRIVVGLASDGVTPAVAPDLTVRLGAGPPLVIERAQFERRGDSYVLMRPVGGIAVFKLDYDRETLTIAAGGLTLGDPADEPVLLALEIALNDDERAVAVRGYRRGGTLKY